MPLEEFRGVLDGVKSFEGETDEEKKAREKRPGLLREVGGQILDTLTHHAPAALAAAIEGNEPFVERDWKDTLIERSRKLSQEQAAKPGQKDPLGPFGAFSREDVQSLGPSLGFSAVGAGAGIGVGAPVGAFTGPVGGFAAGGAASGKAAYNMSANQFLRDARRKLDDDSMKTRGVTTTDDEWKAVEPKYLEAAHEYGLWEAVPEAVGNMLGAGIVMSPARKLVPKALAGAVDKNILTKTATKAAALQLEEHPTETVTQMGQHNVETRAGLKPEGTAERDWGSGRDWWDSWKEIAPTVFLQTAVMGIGAAGVHKGYRALRPPTTRAEQPPAAADPTEPIPATEHDQILREVARTAGRQASEPDPNAAAQAAPAATPAPSPVASTDGTQGTESDAAATPAEAQATPAPQAYARELEALRLVKDPGIEGILTEQDSGYLTGAKLARVQPDGTLKILPAGRRRLKELEAAQPIDEAAHAAATSPENDLTEPSAPQTGAGNYVKGHVDVGGLDISIENPVGSVREDKNNTPPQWKQEMQDHYGYIKGVPARAPDKEHVDTFIKPGTPQGFDGMVFVVDQHTASGKFDEPKVMIGYADAAEAQAAYQRNYQKGWTGGKAITPIPMEKFKPLLQNPRAFMGPQQVSNTVPMEAKQEEARPATAVTVAATAPAETEFTQGATSDKPQQHAETDAARTEAPAAAAEEKPAEAAPVQVEQPAPAVPEVVAPEPSKVEKKAAARKARLERERAEANERARAKAIEDAERDLVSAAQAAELDALASPIEPAVSAPRPAADAPEKIAKPAAENSGLAREQPAKNETVKTPAPKQTAGDLLALHFETSPKKTPVYVALDADGKVLTWSTSKAAVVSELDKKSQTAERIEYVKYDTVDAVLAGKPTKPASAKPAGVIEDVGEKIGGARKDWRDRGLTVADLEAMTGGEEAQNVIKANIWKPDYSAMVKAGATPEAAAMVKAMFDSLAAQPKKDTPEARRQYLATMEKVRAVYEGVKSKEEFRAARDRLMTELGLDGASWWRTDLHEKSGLFSVYKGRREPFSLSFSQRRKVAALVEAGFPDMKQQRAAKDGGNEDGKMPSRPHLDSLEREGADHRNGKDVSAGHFMKTFGFRGVEFGNWAANDERQKHVNQAFDALQDLADVLGIPPQAISLNSTLGLAFGARGSGKAAAHYEPGKLVINITKVNGPGSLAHEWGHAVDHYFGELEQPNAYQGHARGASGWYRKGSAKLDKMRPEMAKAFEGVMGAIFQRDRTKADVVRQSELALERAEGTLKREQDRLAVAERREQTPANADFVKRLKKWIASEAQPNVDVLQRRLADVRGEPEREGGYGKIESSYYGNAQRLSGKSGSQGYWARPTELFARSFEAYVFDQLKRNDYLVHAVEGDRYAGPEYKGNPYPAGVERTTIDKAFEDMFEAMETKTTPKGVAVFSRAQASAETPEVKKWLGKSKVTNVVYHGTPTKDRTIRNFKMPAYFTDEPTFAAMFANEKDVRGGALYPVFLKIEKPYMIDAETSGRHFEWDAEDVASFKKQGFDGVIIKGIPGESSDIYTVFDKDQVRSAIDPALSRGEQGTGMDVAKVQAEADRLTSTWVNSPDVVVVADTHDLPFAAPPDTRGAFLNGTVYVVVKNHHTLEQVQFTVFHEALGHAGLRGMVGERELDRILSDLSVRNASVRAAAKEWMSKNEKPEGWTDQDFKLQAIEEALADLAGKGQAISGVGKLLAHLQRWLRAHGFEKVATWLEGMSQAEALSVLAQARDFVINGRGEPAFADAPDLAPAFSREGAKSYEEQINDLTSGKVVDRTQTITLTGTSDVLAALGLERLSMPASVDILEKVFFDHGVVRKVMHRLPELINDPVLVFDSDTVPGRLMVVTSEVVRGMPLVAIIQPGAMVNHVRTNYITSIYPRVKAQGAFYKWMSEGLLRYQNTQKRPVWQTTLGLRLPGMGPVAQGAGKRVLTQADVVKPKDDGSGGRGGTPALSRAPTTDPATVSRLPMETRIREEVGNLFQSQRTFNRWWHRTVGTQFHKAQQDAGFRKVFDLGQDYLTDTSHYAMQAEAEAPSLLLRMERVTDILKRGISKSDREAIMLPIFEGTLEEKAFTDVQLREQWGLNDRQVGYYREFRASVDKSLDELAKSTLAKMANAIGVKVHDSLALRDLNLHEFHREVLDRVKFRASTLKELVEAMAEGDSGKPLSLHRAIEAKNQIEAMTNLFNRVADLKRNGYAPLQRFGEYTVYVTEPAANPTDEDEQIFFGMYETQREANAAAKALREEYPDADVSQGILSKESWRLFQGVSPDTLEVFAKAAGLDAEPVFQQYLRLAVNNRSAMKRLMKRKGTPGFSQDVTRVLATFVTSNARLTSSNWHLGEMQKAVDAIPKAQGDVKDEATKLWKYLTDPQEEAGALRGFLFFQYLGGSIASAMVNVTQPLTMTFPELTKYANPAVVAKELARAGMEAARNQVSPEIRQAYKRAADEGITSPHEIYQLMAQARGNAMGATGMGKAMKVWGSFFSLAEQFNRRVTFIAAYRLGVKNGVANPYDFAKEAVYSTQGIYNKGNRPNWARGATGATLFTFKQFSISYIEFLKRLHATNQPAFWIAIAVLTLAAGLEGLPFAEDIEDMLDTIGQWLGYSTNTKKALRDKAAEYLGEGAGAFVLHGISAIPGVPLDVAGRMGMHNLIPGTSVLKPSEEHKERDVAEFAGPLGGLAQNIGRAVEAGAKGNFGKAAESILPQAIQNLMKGASMWEKGYYTDTKDRKVIDTTAGEAILKAAGFQPSVVAKESRSVQMAQQDISLHKTTEAGIADKWARGVVDDRPELIEQARAELQNWNEKNPENIIRLLPAQIRSRVKAAQETRAERFAKTAPREIRGQVREDISR